MKKTEIFEKAEQERFTDFLTKSRLDYCTAEIIATRNYIMLKSYNTIVAVYDQTTNILLVDGFYSTTTSKHIAKFKNKMKNAIIINCYLRSDKKAIERYGFEPVKYSKSFSYKEQEENDFENLITSFREN